MNSVTAVHIPCINDWKKLRDIGIPSCGSFGNHPELRQSVVFTWTLDTVIHDIKLIFTDNQPSLGIYILCLRTCTWLNAILMMWSWSMESSIGSFDEFQEFIEICCLPFLCVNLASQYLCLQHRFFQGLNAPMKWRGILPSLGFTYLSRELLLITQCLLYRETKESELLLLLSHP